MAVGKKRLMLAAKRSLILPAILLIALGVVSYVQGRSFDEFLSGAIPLLVLTVLFFVYWLRRAGFDLPSDK